MNQFLLWLTSNNYGTRCKLCVLNLAHIYISEAYIWPLWLTLFNSVAHISKDRIFYGLHSISMHHGLDTHHNVITYTQWFANLCSIILHFSYITHTLAFLVHRHHSYSFVLLILCGITYFLWYGSHFLWRASHFYDSYTSLWFTYLYLWKVKVFESSIYMLVVLHMFMETLQQYGCDNNISKVT